MNAFLLLAQAAEETAAETAEELTAWESVQAWYHDIPAWMVLGVIALLLAAGLWLVVPPTGKRRRVLGALLVAASVGLFLAQVPMLAGIVAPAFFWVLAAIAVLPALAAISSKDPVYCALWFALCLLGVAGLFLYQGALFLGVATVAVYAGAIVVTFLFVLMLAQPEGHAFYDRTGWGRTATGIACLATASLVGVLVYVYSGMNAWNEEHAVELLANNYNAQGEPLVAPEDIASVQLAMASPPRAEETPAPDRLVLVLEREPLEDRDAARIQSLLGTEYQEISDRLVVEFKYVPGEGDVLAPNHVAHLGDQLFGPYLLGVEIAGALLLAALVGAVAIATRGDEARVETGTAKPGEAS